MSPCELSHLIDRVWIGTLLDMEMAMPRTAQASVPALLPIMGAVFISFLIIGVAMPVLPLHVHQGLGLGTFIVGLVAGSQFAASLVSRVWAGRHADSRGAKHAVVTGLVLAAVAGLLYLLSLRFVSAPAISVTILLLGRALLGAGESLIITGAQAWGLALRGARLDGVAGIHHVRGRFHPRAYVPRPSPGQERRREGGSHFPADGGGRPGAALARAVVRDRVDRRWPYRLRLLARVPGFWRRGDAPRAGRQPRPRDGRVHRVSGRRARAGEPGAGTHRRHDRYRHGVPRKRAVRTGRRAHRTAPEARAPRELK